MKGRSTVSENFHYIDFYSNVIRDANSEYDLQKIIEVRLQKLEKPDLIEQYFLKEKKYLTSQCGLYCPVFLKKENNTVH